MGWSRACQVQKVLTYYNSISVVNYWISNLTFSFELFKLTFFPFLGVTELFPLSPFLCFHCIKKIILGNCVISLFHHLTKRICCSRAWCSRRPGPSSSYHLPSPKWGWTSQDKKTNGQSHTAGASTIYQKGREGAAPPERGVRLSNMMRWKSDW